MRSIVIVIVLLCGVTVFFSLNPNCGAYPVIKEEPSPEPKVLRFETPFTSSASSKATVKRGNGAQLLSDEETDLGDDDEIRKSHGEETHYPEEYTLMLLDRSRIAWEEVSQHNQQYNAYAPFIAPQVRSLEESSDLFNGREVKKESFSYYVCKLNSPVYPRRAEHLLDLALDQPNDYSDDYAAERSVFSAGMILFPITGDPDKMLAYLLGRWPRVLNVDTIVKSFGLHAAASVGVFCTSDDRNNAELGNVNQTTYEGCRLDKPMRNQKRSRGGKSTISSFNLDVGDSKLESIRFKPTVDWGTAYITASDSFKFRPHITGEPMEELRTRAMKLYGIYKQFSDTTIYTPLLPYIDPPVRNDLEKALKGELLKNWGTHIENKSIHPHWTYWFRCQNAGEEELGKIYTFWQSKSLKGDETVDLKSKYDGAKEKIPLLKLIRSVPICFEKKWYWFDRGDWYPISENRIQAMKQELEHQSKFDYKDKLFLPSYDEEIIVSKLQATTVKNEEPSQKNNNDETDNAVSLTTEGKKTQESSSYEEELYNKGIVAHLKGLKNISWAALLDRENVLWTKHPDQFEFADVVIKTADHYYLIHVKRAKSNDLGHVCTQAERCAMFLSGLDRSALTEPFMLAEVYSHASLVGRKRTSDHYRNIQMDAGLTKENYTTELLKQPELKTKTTVNSQLKTFLNSNQFDSSFWFNHQKQLLRLFDCIADLEKSKLTPDIITELQDCAKKGIEQASFFTKEGGLLSEQRRKITIVIAIVKDAEFSLGEGEDNVKTNRIVRLHQARQAIVEKHLDFAWTVIPKTSDVPAETLKEYTYTADDVDKLLLLNVEKEKVSNSLTKKIGKGSPQELDPIQVNIGNSKKQNNVRIIRGNNKVYVAQAYDADQQETPKSYIAKTLKELLTQYKISEPFLFVVPFQSNTKLWAGIVFKFAKDNMSIEFLITKEDKDVKKELDDLIESVKKLNAFKDFITRFYNAAKLKIDLDQGVTPTIRKTYIHMRGHTSGSIIHSAIAELVSGKLPLTTQELTDENAYQWKYDDLKKLRDNNESFSKEFEEDPNDKTKPPRLKKGSVAFER